MEREPDDVDPLHYEEFVRRKFLKKARMQRALNFAPVKEDAVLLAQPGMESVGDSE